MKMQTQGFRKDFEDLVDFYFVDAPNIIPIQFVTDPKVINNLEAPPRSWANWKFGCKNTHYLVKTRTIEEALANFANIQKSI
jgi:hypothetical protein